MKGPVIQPRRAPSAILTPISLVRSLTTAYMMLATPTPPMMSVSAPMMPKKISRPIRIFSCIFWPLTVFQTPHTRGSSGSKPSRGPRTSLKCWSAAVHVARPSCTRKTTTLTRSPPSTALKVDCGMTAWVASGPPYVEDCVLRFITPMTVNGELLIRSVFPSGSSGPKMSLAISLPRNTTRRFSSSSAGLRKRPRRLRVVLAGVAVVPARADDAAVDGLAAVGRAPCATRSARPRSRRARAGARARSRRPRGARGSSGPRACPCKAWRSRRATGSRGCCPWPARWTSSGASGPRRRRAGAGS